MEIDHSPPSRETGGAFRLSLRKSRKMLLIYIVSGMFLGILFPILISLFETLRNYPQLTLENISDAYGTIPLVMKIVGPLMLGTAGFLLGSMALRQIRSQGLYAERMRRYSTQLENRNAALTELNETLDGLVYTASHDLKTPVVNFKGLLNMLRMVKDRPESEAMVDDLIEKLDQSADRFMSTITDLLEVSRVERIDVVQKEEILLGGLVNEILKDLEDNIRQSEAEVVLDCPEATMVQVPRHSLQSILQNLISNALKYASQDRTPKVRIAAKHQGNEVHISVADNGQGIDLESHGDKLFQMFTRFHSTASGSGVGLYIVKRTIERLQGTISVSSQPGVGTTFDIVLPQTQTHS